MKKTILVLIFVIITLFTSLYPKKILLPEIANPLEILLDDKNIYITENVSIYIYSLNNFKLIRKFGKKGEGPGEFKISADQMLSVSLNNKEIIVKSIGKISYFSKNGLLNKEIKTLPTFTWALHPVKDRFVGVGAVNEGKGFLAINIYDKKLKKIKELSRISEEVVREEGKFKFYFLRVPISVPTSFSVYKNKIYFFWENNSKIKIYNENGSLEKNISVKEDKLKLSNDYKKLVIKNYKNDKSIPVPIYQRMYKNIQFPEYFPFIRDLRVADNKIYAITYKTIKNKSKLIIYNLKGVLLKETYINLIQKDAIRYYPFTIKNGKIYQLIEDLQDESFYLNIMDI